MAANKKRLQHFNTLTADMLSFLFVTDEHYGKNSGNKKGLEAPELLDRCVRVANHLNVDLSIGGGDRVIHDKKNPQNDLIHNESLTQHFNALAAPHYDADGNHDINLPPNPSRAVRVKGFTFIIWNPCLHTNKTGFQPTPEDMQTLKDLLIGAPGPCIFVSHVPIDNDEKDNQQALKRDKGKPFYSFLPQAPEIRKILEDSGKVFLSIAGHRHRDRQREINGIHYLTMQSLVQRDRKSSHAKGAFYIFQIDDQDIRVRAFGRGQKSYDLPRRPLPDAIPVPAAA